MVFSCGFCSLFLLPTKISIRLRQESSILYNFFNRSRTQYPLLLWSFHSIRQCVAAEGLVSALVIAVKSCTSISSCRGIHARVIKSFLYRDGFIGDQLVTCYNKLGYAEDAQKVFDDMPDRDLVSWNSLICGFSRCLHVTLKAFCTMKFEMSVKPNEVTILSMISACNGALDVGRYIHGFAIKIGVSLEVKVVNSLINMYGKSGDLTSACRLFEAIPYPNIVSWNSIIAARVTNGCAGEGVHCFNKMRMFGIEPDEGTILALLQACVHLGVGKLAESIHGLIFCSGLGAQITIATALLDLYAKLGRLSASYDVFGEVGCADRVAWTAMLAGYAAHGLGREAIKLFESMAERGLEPDHVTFTHLLSACSHSGLVREGKRYFNLMSKVYGIEPRIDHYSCMVDLLGRCGLLNDAYEVIRSMPMEPNAGVWGALLGACRVYGNIELGKEVAEHLIHLEPLDPRNYIMLSNMYAAARSWKDAAKVRALLKERGLKRTPGWSSIEYGNKIHQFFVGDRSHPETEKIYSKLEELLGKIRKTGYSSKTEYVLQDVEEEIKEDMINKHSEKLAIAFGLLVSKEGDPLIITKNLRICGDCHSTAKLISLIEKRTIIIRDPKRFHHFSDGFCSCSDYW
ncbi:pentatricopeptide repeat-containing protein At5g40410, mitochondrial isoform X2 [Cucurbita pepo subsp. pepo]|uniref:pentatricopeptide repeat-containing protein At5g40410, mitochondrial isoform X1 n=1 Tax=Cucurbita pepo subsp. pepo TaxID=3664 RepID=UPI000C9D2926|nr:pentatricopeptide repeat-containing protein At5g40410, mitochondrial isoform X1 [Cucurbita pepo subsp. pepo]XP_023546178.1 pentatricopeptide repeat-containing protein At5g40410, mitochondrial isoform X2 [Cucurbita pepo subsp. pepo]